MRPGMGRGLGGQGMWGSALHWGLTQYLILLPSGIVSSPHLVAKQEGGVLIAPGLSTPHPPLWLLKSECSRHLSVYPTLLCIASVTPG